MWRPRTTHSSVQLILGNLRSLYSLYIGESAIGRWLAIFFFVFAFCGSFSISVRVGNVVNVRGCVSVCLYMCVCVRCSSLRVDRPECVLIFKKPRGSIISRAHTTCYVCYVCIVRPSRPIVPPSVRHAKASRPSHTSTSTSLIGCRES